MRVPLGDGHYRKEKQIRKRPKDEWIPVPVPASGVRLKTLVQVRRLLDGASQVLRGLRCVSGNSQDILRCPDCGRGLVAVSTWKG